MYSFSSQTEPGTGTLNEREKNYDSTRCHSGVSIQEFRECTPDGGIVGPSVGPAVYVRGIFPTKF